MDPAAEAPRVAEARETAVLAKVGAVLNEYCLSAVGKTVAWAYLRKMHEADSARAKAWWLRRLNGRDSVPPAGTTPWQRGCPEVLEGLCARPFWFCGGSEPPAELAWVRALEAGVPEMREELLALRSSGGFQPYRSPGAANSTHAADAFGRKGTDAGAWNVFYLELHNVDFAQNRAKCPKTCALLDAVPRKYGHAFFSAVAPETHITKHNGPTNKKLRCHLPLVVPASAGACRLRVADDTRAVCEGSTLVFDDSFEHEAWNDDPMHARIVLVVDVWHPDLSLRETKFLGFLQTAAMKRDKRECAVRGMDDDNFYAVIDKARHVSRCALFVSKDACTQVVADDTEVWS
ncbi:Aspartyl/Asparaginyl beta-hydroxylase-domain-containing protein [Pelagophyceae sp. CCMP2097]|nr:Aspartyl/Asparaginyl beta-hydroxylase-domain-containing protein [Pelagophyceae sp. CCMP2097]